MVNRGLICPHQAQGWGTINGTAGYGHVGSCSFLELAIKRETLREETVRNYRCPYTGEPLHVESTGRQNSIIVSGALASPSGRRYEINDGIPFLIDPSKEKLTPEEKREAEYYEATAAGYDSIISWLFRSFYEDEDKVRNELIDLLDLRPGSRVLETGCGTCRDSVQIADRLNGGEIYLQDYSPSMLRLGRERMESTPAAKTCTIEYFVGNACQLPFPDKFFDAAFHFGGLNLFSDKRKALSEMARVVRTGGKVVAGDESLAPWLRETEYGRILLNSNHLYTYKVPADHVPECAREVCIRWILGNAFYVVDFRVGEGTPPIDLDLPIQGARGGTHRTRYYGRLEGVTVETKEKVAAAAQRRGMSIHDWLDSTLKGAADRDLSE